MGAVPLLLYAAFWLALFAAYVVLFVSIGATAGQALRNAFASLLPPALLGLMVRQVARVVPWPDRFTLRFFAAQALLAPGYAFACSLLWRGLVMLDQLITLGKVGPPILASIVAFQSLMYTVCYVGLAAASYAQSNAARVRRAESLRAQAELALLRSQLNPHFVLNTLHALMGLVRREPATAEAALERLGELLRFGLRVHHANVDQVAFREEWAFVNSYLALEQMRLGDRLRLTLRADEDAMDVPVPPFALQPLVENAITHAISPRREGGRLDLTARREGGRLLLEVEDDGPGATEAAVFASPRLGVRLLRERLAALYAGEARLAFEAMDQGGLRVRLDLPDAGAREAA
jgi:signal transduction histidine kinase